MTPYLDGGGGSGDDRVDAEKDRLRLCRLPRRTVPTEMASTPSSSSSSLSASSSAVSESAKGDKDQQPSASLEKMPASYRLSLAAAAAAEEAAKARAALYPSSSSAPESSSAAAATALEGARFANMTWIERARAQADAVSRATGPPIPAETPADRQRRIASLVSTLGGETEVEKSRAECRERMLEIVEQVCLVAAAILLLLRIMFMFLFLFVFCVSWYRH